MPERILVTGGAGYIGSHTCLSLLQAGHPVTVVDNLANSSAQALERVRELAGPDAPDLVLEKLDLLDYDSLARVLEGARFAAVVHFAGLKAVGDSVAEPLRYWHNNVTGSLNLLRAMALSGVKKLVFSSSATVYGTAGFSPLDESAPLGATNPYGRTKLAVEEILRDLAGADPGWAMVLLRYFNPAGAHASGRIGEDPAGVPNNLMPFVMQVAVGRRPEVRIFGDDYPTADGTGVRDYVHVVDLAEGHLAALRTVGSLRGAVAVNLGTGRGYSVKEVVAAASRACGHELVCRVVGRRPGDVAELVADASYAESVLGWRARRGLDEMCADHWRWQAENPEGYGS
jgi:UDP-glucose 4-epimerase